MYNVEWTDPKTGDKCTDDFPTIDAAMRFATLLPLWWLLDDRGDCIANGETGTYQWKRQPDNCPPWW